MMGVVGVRRACWETVGVAFGACASFAPSLQASRENISNSRTPGRVRRVALRATRKFLRLYAARAQRGGNDRRTQLCPLWQGVRWSPAAPPTEAFRALTGLRPRSAEVKLLV